MDYTFDRAQYDRNIELYSKKDALMAHHLYFVHEPESLHFCHSKKNELNLYKKNFGIKDYYHSQEGALEEAEGIVLEEISETTQVIYFYGLGLGYIYDALREWLTADPKRSLILLEDDPEVIYHFLHTERAETVLRDTQVLIYFCTKIDAEFYKMVYRQRDLKSQFLSLPLYVEKHQTMALQLYYGIYYNQSWLEYMHGEYLSGQAGFSSNYYPNLLSMPDSYLGSGLFEKFKNVPAIICGAGPSIEKNIEVLKTLGDRALIFAGGSALNVLNSYGMTPHFGLGIDPNPEQVHRLLTNNAFYLPFFYRNRMTHQAFQIIQGPRLYVPGSTQPLPNWFENKLNMPSPEMDEGYNVVNFCTEIAGRMGCNPIIYVGLDLAYSTTQNYASGITIHPNWLGRSDPYAPEAHEQLIRRVGIEGKEVITKWMWLAESIWISHYAANHSEIKVINATEGGIGLPSIPDVPLALVAAEHLTKTYDLFTRIQGEIQNNKNSLTTFQIIHVISEMKKSLEICLDLCKKIIAEEEQHKESPVLSFYSANAVLYETLLREEIAYENFLVTFDQAGKFFQDAKYAEFGKDFNEGVKRLTEHYLFLRDVIDQQLRIIQKSVQSYIFSSPHQRTESELPPNPTQKGELYQFQGQELRIVDKELDLDEKVTFEPVEETEYYSDKQLKMSSFYTKDKKLQGPSRFYAESGQLLVESWFIEGLREGKSRIYYLSGNPYALLRFKQNKMESKQEYFYPNGKPHMILHFKEGLLDGEILIYSSKGHLLRELHYRKGLRHGLEKSWSPMGELEYECRYEDGIPAGTGWVFSKDRLIREVKIHEYPDNFDLTEWDSKGAITNSYKNGLLDFSHVYAENQQKADTIQNVLNDMMKKMEDILLHSDDPRIQNLDPQFLKDFELLKGSNQQIKELGDQLQNLKEDYFKQTEEAQQQLLNERKRGHEQAAKSKKQ